MSTIFAPFVIFRKKKPFSSIKLNAFFITLLKNKHFLFWFSRMLRKELELQPFISKIFELHKILKVSGICSYKCDERVECISVTERVIFEFFCVSELCREIAELCSAGMNDHN